MVLYLDSGEWVFVVDSLFADWEGSQQVSMEEPGPPHAVLSEASLGAFAAAAGDSAAGETVVKAVAEDYGVIAAFEQQDDLLIEKTVLRAVVLADAAVAAALELLLSHSAHQCEPGMPEVVPA